MNILSKLSDALKSIKYHENKFYVFFLIISVGLLTSLVISALFSRPIADDFHYFNELSSQSFFSYMSHFYTDSTARLAQGLSMSIFYRIFSTNSVILVPIIEIFLLLATIYWVFHSLFILFKAPEQNIKKSVVLAALSVSFILLYIPSLFDSLYWLTSSTVYTLSLVSLMFNLGFILNLYQMKKMKWWWLILLALSVTLSQTFSEATAAIIIVLTGIVFGLYLWLYRKRIDTKKILPILGTTFLSSIIGFLIVYLSPGSHTRQTSAGSQFDFHAMFLGSASHTMSFLQTFISWQLLLIIGSALLLSYLLPKFNKKNLLTMGTLGIFLTIIPAYITFAISAYSMGTYTPLRLYSIPAFFTSVGIFLFIAALYRFSLVRFSSTKNVLSSLTLPFASILLVLGFLMALPSIKDILGAQVLRASLYNSRGDSIASQKEKGSSDIHLTPAPILLNYSEAGDFSFTQNQVSWFEDSFKQYYNISDKKIVLDSIPPKGYCSTTQAPTWYGVETCKQQAAL